MYKSSIKTDDKMGSTCYTENIVNGEKKMSVTYDLWQRNTDLRGHINTTHKPSGVMLWTTFT